jgi:D-alanine-D-alanine ligase
MLNQVAIVYNEPEPSRYDSTGEMKAVLGVLDSVKAVGDSLCELGYSVTRLPLTLPVEKAAEELKNLKTELVFNLFEGFCGFPETEALVPESLSELGIPFTGCQGDIIRLSLDKSKMKAFLQAAGVPTPEAQLLSPEMVDTFHLAFPCIVKPCNEDASHGLTGDSVVNDLSSLKRQVKIISQSYGGKALVERFLDGREFSATVMGITRYSVLPVSEMVYALPPGMSRILTFAAKWEPDSLYFKGTNTICPADITREEEERIAKVALTVFRLIGCKGYARVDMRADGDGRINVMEVNPNPDISPGTGVARQSTAAGMTYTKFIDTIIQLALENESDDNQYPPDVNTGQTRIDANTAGYSRVQTS